IKAGNKPEKTERRKAVLPMAGRSPVVWRKNSMLFKLLSSFGIVIGLLLSFNLLTFTFFQDSIHNEITRTNTQNFQNAVERYENQFQIVQLEAIRLFFNNHLFLLGERSVSDYFASVNAVVD